MGALTATLDPSFNPLLLKDGRIHVMRSVNGGPAQREGESCFLIRRWDYADDYTTITALHANDLMRRRAVLYGINVPGSGNQGIITNEYADDAIKLKWKENAGSSIATSPHAYSTVTLTSDNTQADLSSYVTVQANLSAAPQIYKVVWWRNLLDLFLEIGNTSYLAGTYLSTEIVTPTESTLELRTYTGQRGVDRRFSTGNGLIFSAQRGNMAQSVLSVDAQQEITFVQSLGVGEGFTWRAASYALDTTRMAESPFGRIEAIFDSGNTPNDASLTNDASGAVRGGRPQIAITSHLTETDQCIRGVHYNYGDLVTVQVQGVQYDCRLDQLDVTLSQDKETTKTGFRYNG